MKKLKYILFLFIIFLTPIVFAATVDITNNVYAPGVSSCDINSPANYLYYGSSGGGGTGSMGNACIGGTSCNVTNQGYLTMLVASITYNLQPSTSYNITFSNPVRTSSQNGFKNLTTSNVRGFISQYCASDEAYSLTINSVTFDGAKVIVNFTTPSYFNSYTWFRIILGNGSSNISAQDTFRLNWVSLEDLSSGSTSNDTQSIINNNNSNTQNIINNDNSNTQSIINNNNQNTQQIIDSNKVCNIIDKNNITIPDSLLNSDGSISSSTASNGITDYIKINSSSIINVLSYNQSSSTYLCFYDYNKNVISCLRNSDAILNSSLSIPSNAEFVRFTIRANANVPTFQLCKNGNQAMTDSLTDSTVDSGTGSDFFDNFTSQDFGLSQIITIPLNTIQSLTSKTCVPLEVPIPFTNSNVSLPCMSHIYETKFPSIFNLWKIVSFGIIAYLISIDIFHIVKGFKDPESDKVEVLDL